MTIVTKPANTIELFIPSLLPQIPRNENKPQSSEARAHLFLFAPPSNYWIFPTVSASHARGTVSFDRMTE